MARRSDDVIGFTRIFVLFCTLVLLPSLLMSGFGVIAILNVREADKQRRRDAAEELIRKAEQRFVAVLEASDRVLRTALEQQPSAECVDASACLAVLAGVGPEAMRGATAVFTADGEPIVIEAPLDDPGVREQIVRALQDTTALRPAHLAIEGAALSAVLSLQRLSDGRSLVYAVDGDAVAQAVAALSMDREGWLVWLRLDRPSSTAIVNALERLMGELVADRAPAKATPTPTADPTKAPSVSRELLASRRLHAPFDRFTLGIEAPPSTGSQTIIAVYIVLLVVFLATLITGVVVTARLIYQETRLSRLKTDFVSHMSHELRTPLTAIRLFIETLKLGRAESEEERAECLELLAKETERLSEMIERVLGYARLKAGRRIFHVEPVAVQEIVDDAIDAFRAHTLAGTTRGAEGLDVRVEVTSGLPPIAVDREAVVEALLNLIGNAWKYTGPDKVITIIARPGRRGRVVLGVQDNGPGLPKAEHARIFERFYQSRSLLSSKQPGSGLGLAITRAIVEGQGGRIWVESEPGKGALFGMELRAGKERTAVT